MSEPEPEREPAGAPPKTSVVCTSARHTTTTEVTFPKECHIVAASGKEAKETAGSSGLPRAAMIEIARYIASHREDAPPLQEIRACNTAPDDDTRRMHVRRLSVVASVILKGGAEAGFSECFQAVGEVTEQLARPKLVLEDLAEQIGDLAKVFMEAGSSGYEEIVPRLVKPVCRLLLDTEAAVCDAAAQALLRIIQHLETQELQSPVLGVALCLAHDHKPRLRCVAARLLAGLATRLRATGSAGASRSGLAQECLTTCATEACCLASDPEENVREAVVPSIGEICAAVSNGDADRDLEGSEQLLLTAFEKLSRDTGGKDGQQESGGVGVRIACAAALPRVVEAMPSTCRSEELFPIFKRLARRDAVGQVRRAAVQQVGALIDFLEGEDLTEATEQFTDFIKQTELAGKMQVEALYCSENFVKVLRKNGISGWNRWQEAFERLARLERRGRMYVSGSKEDSRTSHSIARVRGKLVSSLHEIVKLIGLNDTEEHDIYEVLELLLEDDHKFVRRQVLGPAMQNFVRMLGGLPIMRQQQYLTQVLSATDFDPPPRGEPMHKANSVDPRLDWRRREIMAKGLSNVLEQVVFGWQPSVSVAFLRDTVQDRLLKLAADPVAKVRAAALSSVGPLASHYQQRAASGDADAEEALREFTALGQRPGCSRCR